MTSLFTNLLQKVVISLKLTKLTEQIFDESLKSLKSLMQIFVGKASCESTVMYRVKSRIPSCYLRSASVIALICFLGVGEVWGDTGAMTVNRTVILPAGSTTAYSSSDWTGAGAPSYGSGTANEIDNITISGSVVGSVKFVGAGGSGWLQLKSGTGYIETVITSTEGVDVEVYMKSNGTYGTVTASLTGAASSQTVTGTTAGTKTLSTTSTSATLTISCASNAAQIGYIKITPKAKFTVTFYNAYGKSTPSAVTQTTGGGAVTLPSALPTDDCAEEGWAFAGWKTSSYQTSDASYMNGLIPAGSYIPGGDESLYAVFRKAGDATSTTYTCTSTSGATDNKFTANTAAGGYTITLAKGNSSSWYKDNAPWRMYSDGTTLTVSGSNPISSLGLVHNSTYYASFTSSVVGSTVTMASSSGGTTTVTDINANTITLTSGGSAQNRISSITVYYTAYTYRSNPVCTYDYFVDIMHDKVVADQAGNYSMPAITGGDATPGNTYCDEKHYHFLGWVEESEINDDGTLKAGATLYPAGDAGHTAANKTFYAIWAKEE